MKLKLEEELCETQEEKERQEGRLLEKLRMQPRVVLRRADMCEKYLGPEWQEPKLPGVKTEALEPPSGKEEELLQHPNIKKEEQLPPCTKKEGDVSELLVTGVVLKTEEEGGLDEPKLPGVKEELEPPIGKEEETRQPRNIKKEEQLPPCIKKEGDVSQLPVTVVVLKTEEEEGLNEPNFPGVKEELEPLSGKEEETLQTLNIKKEEQLPPCIKEERDVSEMPVTGVFWKTEGEGGPDEEKKEVEPPSSSQHVITEINGKHGGGSQALVWLALISDGYDTASHSSRTDVEDEEWVGEMIHPTISKRWKCSQCGRSFSAKFLLKRHMKCHTGEKPYPCFVCGQRFQQNSDLRMHIRIHTGEKPFPCLVCGQRFARKGNMRRHTKTHTGDKPFACLVCGKRFQQSSDLRLHTRTHTGEKPFACSVCGKMFSRKNHMREHTKTHTDEKPFPCSVCGKRFSLKYRVKAHAVIHTGEKPFACLVCGKRFYLKTGLKVHMMTHPDEKPFACSV